MLKHTDSNTEQVPAAKVRVTPEELAAAITRLEARKDAGHRDLEGTISIGEVVQQLGLDATPEEVLAEVQAGRQKAMPANRLSRQGRWGLSLAAGALIIVLAALQVQVVKQFTGSPSSNVATFSTPSASPVAGSSPTQHILLDPDLLVGEASGKVVMLSEVSDNQPVHCTLNGTDLAFQPYSPSSAETSWTLIKHGGKVYVRGRVQAMSAKVLARNGMDVLCSSPNVSADGLVKPITIPVDGFDVVSVSMNTMFHAQNLRLDKHAWEKW